MVSLANASVHSNMRTLTKANRVKHQAERGGQFDSLKQTTKTRPTISTTNLYPFETNGTKARVLKGDTKDGNNASNRVILP